MRMLNIVLPSLSRVYTYLIFSTKHRKNRIDKQIENDLYNYLGGICRDLECNPVQIGGYKNHVPHFVPSVKKSTQMKLVQEVKQGSSKWIKTMGSHILTFIGPEASGDMAFSRYHRMMLIN